MVLPATTALRGLMSDDSKVCKIKGAGGRLLGRRRRLVRGRVDGGLVQGFLDGRLVRVDQGGDTVDGAVSEDRRNSDGRSGLLSDEMRKPA